MELELKWLRLKRKTDYFGGERREANQPGVHVLFLKDQGSLKFSILLTKEVLCFK